MADRDKRRHHTPPAGIAAQIARPPTEDGFDDEHTPPATAAIPTPVNMAVVDREHEGTLTALERRSRETKNTSIDTLRLVNELRSDVKIDITRLDEKIGAQGEKIDTQGAILSDVREKLAEHVGKSDVIIGMLKEQQTITTTTKVAEVEVTKTREISNIKLNEATALDQIDAKKAKRELVKSIVIKSLAAIGVAWAAISAAIMNGC